MFVRYSPKHPHIKVVPVVDGISVSAESVILNPGTNEVSDGKWEKIKASLSAEIAVGTVKPFSVQKSGNSSKATTLKDVPAAVAAKIIGGCSNKDTLRSWFKEPLSDELALLVVRRMRQLNMDIDEMAESEELSDGDIIDESASATETDGGNESGDGKKEPETAPAATGYDGMSYKELQAVAGIDPQQKKEALLAALKGDGGETEGEDDNGGEGSGDGIPDFDDPNMKVS